VSAVEFIALILAGVGPVLALARVLRLPDSLALFGAGVAAAFVPGLPAMRLDTQVMMGLFLPPVLYATTVRASLHLLRFTLIPGVLFGAVLTLATMAAATLAARTLLPGLSWIAAALLGILVSVFDTRLFHEAKGRPRVPRAIADALKTREMVTRVLALASFTLALGALAEGPPSVAGALMAFGYDVVGGVLAGTVIGHAVVRLRDRVDPAPVEIAVSVATPYVGALVAQALGLSVVVVIMAAALVVTAVRIDRRTGAPRSSSEARIVAMAFWEQASLMLSAVLFFLAGWALPEAMRSLDQWAIWRVAGAAAGLLAVVLALQYAVGFATAALPPAVGALKGSTRAAAAAVIAWASTRSVIGLLLALSIPATLPDGRPFAERDLILVVVSLVIVGSVLVQGLTLRSAVRGAALSEPEEEEREERIAERAMTDAHAAAARGEGHQANGFDAERRALLALREEDRIGDEVLRRMLRETDLRSRATEKSALPGAGPPSP